MEKPHKTTPHQPRNEGEGSQTGARQYDEGAREFAKSGRVEGAAEDARAAVEGPEADELRAAEEAGKARSAEEDPALSGQPSWWDDDYDVTWQRLGDELSRDWDATKRDIWRRYGSDLNQSVVDTLRQATGTEPMAPGDVANPLDISFDEVEPALRFGHGASLHHGGQEWNRELETHLEREWEDMGQRLPWRRVRPYVRHGFALGRTTLQ